MKPVRIRFAPSIPLSERRWMGPLIRRAARLWGIETYEYQVSAVADPSVLGKCTVKRLDMATIVEIVINPTRYANRPGLRVDLVHELLHVLDEDVRDAFVDLAAHIPDPIRRRRALRRAERKYEVWHDRYAHTWARLLAPTRAERAQQEGA